MLSTKTIINIYYGKRENNPQEMLTHLRILWYFLLRKLLYISTRSGVSTSSYLLYFLCDNDTC